MDPNTQMLLDSKPLVEKTISNAKPITFNSLGYRGEEIKIDKADSTILFAGCSYTFGMGVADVETWPYRLLQRIKSHYSAIADDFQILNLSQIGASNSYILRSLLTKIDEITPKLVVVKFTHFNREEFYDEEELYNIGYWDVRNAKRYPEVPLDL